MIGFGDAAHADGAGPRREPVFERFVMNTRIIPMNTRLIVAAVVLLGACGTSQNQESVKPKSLKQMGSVDQLLAPVALYPDPLIAQILMSAQDPPR
jgi:hypothetical protein